MAKRCKNTEYEFRPLHIIDFHVNAGIAGIGFLYILCLTIHALYKYISISYGCCSCIGNNKQQNDNRRRARHNKPKRMNGKSFCALISVLICSLLLFVIYTMEFWFLRACNYFQCNINPFQFCNYFQHFLYGSVSIYTWILYIYFSVRLETSFGSSSLAFPTDCFVVIRILATIAVIFGIAVAFVFTCGIPWDVSNGIITDENITDKNPMLCRNVVLWKWYWEAIYVGGAIMLLSANFMNWVGYINRLTKLLAMKLRFAFSFKAIVEQDMDRRNMQKNMKRNKNTVDDMSIINTIDDIYNDDDEDYDDDTYHKYSDDSMNTTNIEMNTTPLPMTPVINENNALEADTNNNGLEPHDMMVIHNNHNTVISQSTFSQNHENKNKPVTASKSDIKNRMISRRKPNELRFYNLIRKQSVLTGVVSLSSMSFWGIQLLLDKGSIFILTDIIINVTCVYLSVSWTKPYYNKLCGQCQNKCCCCCEDCIESKVKRELQIEAKQKQKELRAKRALEEQEKEKHHE